MTRRRSADLIDAIRRVDQGDAVFSPQLAGFVLDAFAGATAAEQDDELDLLTRANRRSRLIARGYMYKGDRPPARHLGPRWSRPTPVRPCTSSSSQPATNSPSGPPSETCSTDQSRSHPAPTPHTGRNGPSAVPRRFGAGRHPAETGVNRSTSRHPSLPEQHQAVIPASPASTERCHRRSASRYQKNRCSPQTWLRSAPSVIRSRRQAGVAIEIRWSAMFPDHVLKWDFLGRDKALRGPAASPCGTSSNLEPVQVRRMTDSPAARSCSPRLRNIRASAEDWSFSEAVPCDAAALTNLPRRGRTASPPFMGRSPPD